MFTISPKSPYIYLFRIFLYTATCEVEHEENEEKVHGVSGIKKNQHHGSQEQGMGSRKGSRLLMECFRFRPETQSGAFNILWMR